MTLQAHLRTMQDEEYRAFQSALMPTVNPGRIIGVRVPQLRAYARQIQNTSEAAAFMASLPHETYEEDNLHAYLIEFMRNWDDCIAALERFLPFVDNWATCDGMNPKVLIRHPDRLLARIDAWLASGHTYTVRFAIGMLMRHFLDDRFDPAFLEKIAAIRSDEYYINMMVAWYFATALAKQWQAALPFIAGSHLPVWTHNKAIQKAIESRRILPQQKELLKKMKIFP